MPKQAQIIAAAVIALIIIAGVAFFVVTHRTKSQPQVSTPATQNQSTQAAETESSGSFKTLLGMNKNVSCDVNFGQDKNMSGGTIYVSGKKMRGDFSIKTADGKVIDNHMIADETYIWGWSSVMSQGTKMSINEINVSPAPGSSAQKQGFDMNQSVSYKCADWSVDNSKFTPPTNVQFIDISQMMKSVNQTTTGSTGSNSGSSYCNQITDPTAKAACMAAYSSK